jgi:hypothetical protein
MSNCHDNAELSNCQIIIMLCCLPNIWVRYYQICLQEQLVPNIIRDLFQQSQRTEISDYSDRILTDH